MQHNFVSLRDNYVNMRLKLHCFPTVAVAQWGRAFASQAEGWVFESLPRQTCQNQVVTAPLVKAQQ